MLVLIILLISLPVSFSLKVDPKAIDDLETDSSITLVEKASKFIKDRTVQSSPKYKETPLQYKHTKNKIRGCYVPAPLNERKMAEQFNLEDYIDDICTHMFIPVSAREEVNDEIRFQFEFYADLQGQKPVMDCENQGGHGCTVLQNLKILSPRLSTVLSLSLDEKLYTKILNEKVDKDNKPSKMDSLIDNLLKFAFERSFDGIEFSWTRADKHVENLEKMGEFFHKLRLKKNDLSGNPQNDAFHIFARIPAYQTAEIEYVKDKDWMKNLAKDIDYLNLSTFLFQETPLEIMYGHEAIAATPKKKKIKPIRKLLYDDVLSDAVAAENENGIHMVEKWINAGMPRSKIVYGMPFNAYGISLLSAPQKKDNEKIEKFETKKHEYLTNLLIKSKQFLGGLFHMVLAGLKLKADMFMPYYEYCKIESLYEGIVRKGSYGNFYAGEDDFDVLEKLAYVRENRLAGVFTANLNGDDKKGLCKKGGMRFPLMSLVRQAFTGEYTYAFNKPVKETLQEIAAEKAKQDEEKAQTQLVHNETAALNEKNLETAQVEPKTQAEEHVWQTSNIEYGPHLPDGPILDHPNDGPDPSLHPLTDGPSQHLSDSEYTHGHQQDESFGPVPDLNYHKLPEKV